MHHDQALIERLVTEFIAGYMLSYSGDYFVRTYTDSKTRVEVIRQVTSAAFTNAYAAARWVGVECSEEEAKATMRVNGLDFLPTIGG